MTIRFQVEKHKITGLPNQVKWANAIRKKRVELIEKNGIRVLGLAIRPHVTEEMLQSVRANTVANCTKLSMDVAVEMCAVKDPKWWIENRELHAYHNVSEAVKSVIKRRKKDPYR